MGSSSSSEKKSRPSEFSSWSLGQSRCRRLRPTDVEQVESSRELVDVHQSKPNAAKVLLSSDDLGHLGVRGRSLTAIDSKSNTAGGGHESEDETADPTGIHVDTSFHVSQ